MSALLLGLGAGGVNAAVLAWVVVARVVHGAVLALAGAGIALLVGASLRRDDVAAVPQPEKAAGVAAA